ncbi:MAG: anti-sigma factor family protein [Gemmatimonadota bacterium]
MIFTCREARDRIEAYVDPHERALTTDDVAALEAHLESCAACRRQVDLARALLGELRNLPRSIEPPAAVWPAVARQTGARGRARVAQRWPLLAAAALLLVALSSGITALLVRRTPVVATAPTPRAAPEAAYASAAAELTRALAAERHRLRPETLATLERNLAVIDQAIAESRAALARDPANQSVETLLLAAYRQKVGLLEQALRLSASS